MAHIEINRTHHLSLEQLKAKIDDVMTDIQQKIEFQSEWENENEFSFRRKGAKGSIEIDESNFALNLNLGIMFRAMKGQIESKIVKAVDQYIV